ncbi:MAG: hypothetical protein KDE59_06030 [Anaerolineales bacterium]|nr:hypothetical protein [Anaerolineales bacterium]
MPKRRPKGRSRGTASRVTRELQQAAMFYNEGLLDETLALLLPLQHRYPHNASVLRMLQDIFVDIEDWSSTLYYGTLLLAVTSSHTERIDLLNNLTASCQQLELAFLSEKYGRLLLAASSDREAAEKVEAFLQLFQPFFEREIGNVQAVTGLDKADSFKLLQDHEWCRFLVEHMFVDEARPLLKELAAKAPQFTPVQNNLATILFLDGDLGTAQATTNHVLSVEPDNYHALANLSRIHFFNGKLAKAHAAADRLLQVQNDNSDLPFKKIETLTYLGADKEILTVYHGLRNKNKLFGLAQIQFAAGTAHYRLGDEKAASKLWRTASRHDNSGIAQRCLEESRLQPGERNIPWYILFDGWFLRGLAELVSGNFNEKGQVSNSRQFDRALERFVQKQPALINLLPHMLTIGDQPSRVFALMVCKHVNTVETATILRDFGQSPYGPDQLRMDALLFVTDNFPELLPENRYIMKWVKGQQQEIVLLDFSITFEPGPLDFPPRIHDRYEDAYDLMHEGKFAEAEPILKQLIVDVPEFRSAYSGLLATYKSQQRKEEAAQLTDELFARFPDYFFARTAMTEQLIAQGKIAEAREMVAPLLSMKELHISEFRALANVYMSLCLKDGRKEEARSWLGFWESVESDHPALEHWRIELADMKGLLGQLLKKLEHDG